MRSSAAAYGGAGDVFPRLENLRSGLFIPGALALSLVLGAGAVISPLHVLALVFGLVFVVTAVRSLAAGLVLFIVLTFFEGIPAFSTSGVTLSKLAGVVLAGLWLMKVLARNQRAPVLSLDQPFVAAVLVLLAFWTVTSAVWAVDSGVALHDAFQWVQQVLLVFVVYTALDSPRRIKWVVWAFIAGATFSALVGLTGVTSPDRVGLPSADAPSRLSGGIGDPNQLAALLVPAIVFAVFALAVVRNPLARLTLVASAAVCALALLQTESRGGILASGVVLIAAALFSGPVKGRALAGISIAAAFGVLYFTAVAPPQAFARITEFSSDQGSGRVDIWKVAVHVAEHHPVLGVGAGNFIVVEPDYVVTDINLRRTQLVLTLHKVVHNTYLHVLAELGAVGLSLYAAMLGAALRMGGRAVKTFAAAGHVEMEVLARGLIVGTIGMIAADFFLSAQHEKHIALLIGVLMALLSVARRLTSTAQQEDEALLSRSLRL